MYPHPFRLRPPLPVGMATSQSLAEPSASTTVSATSAAGATSTAARPRDGPVAFFTLSTRSSARTAAASTLPRPPTRGLALRNRMPLGPRLTSGATRRAFSIALGSDGSGASAGRGSADLGQIRRKSPPGPNWHNGGLLIVLLPFRIASCRLRPSICRRVQHLDDGVQPSVGVRGAMFLGFRLLFGYQLSLTSFERQAFREFFSFFFSCRPRIDSGILTGKAQYMRPKRPGDTMYGICPYRSRPRRI